MKTISRTYNIILKTLTPVYIGGATEKNLVEGIDFYEEENNNKVYIINQEKLLSILKNINKLQDYTLKLKEGKAIEFLKDNIKKGVFKLTDITNIEYDVQFKITKEIKAFIKNGFGLPYIPGSSIKGAIRSAILGYLYQNNSRVNAISNKSELDKILYGEKKEINNNGNKTIIETHQSIMRFIQITDAHFYQKGMNLYNTKIYSMLENLSGSWKDKRKGSKREFDEYNFVTTYECIDCNETSTLRINITEQIINLLKNEKPLFTDTIIKLSDNTDPLKEIFRMINEQTRLYLEKEIEFFNHHRGDKHEIILEQIESLKANVLNFIKNDNYQALLHLGSGSGFHGITGDWRFNSHIIDRIKHGSNRGLINGDEAAKTRRLIFSRSKDYDYVFTPMGFVMLSMIELSDEILKTYFSDNKEDKVKEKEENKISKDSQTPKSEIKSTSNTSSIPKLYNGKIVQGQTIVPAVVVKSGKPNIVKLLIENNESELPLNGYASEIAEGTYLKVRIAIYSKNQIKQVNYVGEFK